MQALSAAVHSGSMPPPKSPESLAERLRMVLDQTGLAAQTLSKKAGLAPGHVGLIVTGKVKGGVTPETMRRIAEAAGVDYEWLATGAGTPGSPARPSAPGFASRHSGGSRPIFRNLPGWDAAEKEGRRRYPGIPGFAWRKAGDTTGESAPGSITPEVVAQLARWWMTTATDEDLMAADEAAADDEIADLEKRAELELATKRTGH